MSLIPREDDDVSCTYVGACTLLNFHPNRHIMAALSIEAREAAAEKARANSPHELGRQRAASRRYRHRGLSSTYRSSSASLPASATAAAAADGADSGNNSGSSSAQNSRPGSPNNTGAAADSSSAGSRKRTATPPPPGDKKNKKILTAMSAVRVMPHSQVVHRDSSGRVISAPAPALDLSHTYCGGKGMLPLMPVFLTAWFDTLRTINLTSCGLQDESIKELAYCFAEGKRVSNIDTKTGSSTIMMGSNSKNNNSVMMNSAASGSLGMGGSAAASSVGGIGTLSYVGGGNSKHIIALILDHNLISMVAADDLKRLRRSIAPTATFSIEHNPALVPSLVAALATAKYACAPVVAGRAASVTAASVTGGGAPFDDGEGSFTAASFASANNRAAGAAPSVGAGSMRTFRQQQQKYFSSPSESGSNTMPMDSLKGSFAGGATLSETATAALMDAGHKWALQDLERVRRRLLRHRHLLVRREQQLAVLSFAIENPGPRWFPTPSRPLGGWLTLGCLFSLPPVANSVEREMCVSAVRRINTSLRPYKTCIVPVFLDQYHIHKLREAQYKKHQEEQEQELQRIRAEEKSSQIDDASDDDKDDGEHQQQPRRKRKTPMHQEHSFPPSQNDPTLNAFLQLGVSMVVVFATEHTVSYQLDHWMFAENNSIFGQRRAACGVALPLLYRRTTSDVPRVFRALPAHAKILRQIIDRANSHYSAFGAACFTQHYRACYSGVTREGEIMYDITMTNARNLRTTSSLSSSSSSSSSAAQNNRSPEAEALAAEVERLNSTQSAAEARQLLEKALCSDLLAATGKIRELITRRSESRSLDAIRKVTSLPKNFLLRRQYEKDREEQLALQDQFSPLSSSPRRFDTSRSSAFAAATASCEATAAPKPFASFTPGAARVMLQELLSGFVHVAFLPDDPAGLAEMKLAAREFDDEVAVSVQCRSIAPRSKWSLLENIWIGVGLPASDSPCSNFNEASSSSSSNNSGVPSSSSSSPFRRVSITGRFFEEQTQQQLSPQFVLSRADSYYIMELARQMKSSTAVRVLVLWDLDSIEDVSVTQMAVLVTTMVRVFKQHGLKIIVLMDASSARHRKIWQDTSASMGSALQILDQSRPSDATIEKILSTSSFSSSFTLMPMMKEALVAQRSVGLARLAASSPCFAIHRPQQKDRGTTTSLLQSFVQQHFCHLLDSGRNLAVNDLLPRLPPSSSATAATAASSSSSSAIRRSSLLLLRARRDILYDASAKTVTKFFESLLTARSSHRVGLPLALLKFGLLRVHELKRVRPRGQSLLAGILLTPIVAEAPDDDAVLLHMLGELHDELDWSMCWDFGLWNAPLQLASASLERNVTILQQQQQQQQQSTLSAPSSVLTEAAACDATRAVDTGTFPLTLHFMALMTPADLTNGYGLLSEVGIMRAAKCDKLTMLLHLLDDWKVGAASTAEHQHPEEEGGLGACRMCSYLQLIGKYKTLVQHRPRHLLTTFVELDETNIFFRDRESALVGRSFECSFIPYTLTPCRIFCSSREALMLSLAAEGSAAAGSTALASSSPSIAAAAAGAVIADANDDGSGGGLAAGGSASAGGSSVGGDDDEGGESTVSASTFEFFSSTNAVYCFLRSAADTGESRKTSSAFGGGSTISDETTTEYHQQQHKDDSSWPASAAAAAAAAAGRKAVPVVGKGEIAMFPPLSSEPVRLRTHSHPISDACVVDERGAAAGERRLDRICVASCTELSIVIVISEPAARKLTKKYHYDSSIKVAKTRPFSFSPPHHSQHHLNREAAAAAATGGEGGQKAYDKQLEALVAATTARSSAVISVPAKLSAVALGTNDGGAGWMSHSRSSGTGADPLVPPLAMAGSDCSLAACGFALSNESQQWQTFPAVTRRVVFISFLSEDVTLVSVDHVGAVLVWGSCDSPAPGLVLTSVSLGAAPLRVLPHRGFPNEIVLALPTLVLTLEVGREECLIADERPLPRGFRGDCAAGGADGSIIITDGFNDAVVVQLGARLNDELVAERSSNASRSTEFGFTSSSSAASSSSQQRLGRSGRRYFSTTDDADSSAVSGTSSATGTGARRRRGGGSADNEFGEEVEEFEEASSTVEPTVDEEEHHDTDDEEEEEEDWAAEEARQRERAEKERTRRRELEEQQQRAAQSGAQGAVIKDRFSPERRIGQGGGAAVASSKATGNSGKGRRGSSAAFSKSIIGSVAEKESAGRRARACVHLEGMTILTDAEENCFGVCCQRVASQLRSFNEFAFAVPSSSDAAFVVRGGFACFTSKNSLLWWRLVDREDDDNDE